MSQTNELLEAIFAEPDDLARRLVYADARMAEGDPRGRFIAQQCRLETLDPLDPDYPAVVADTDRLWATHAATWLGPVFDLLEIPEAEREREAQASHRRWAFRRGFLASCALPLEVAAKVADGLARVEPIDGITLLVGEWIPPAQRSFVAPSTWRYVGVEPDGWFTDNSLAHVLHWGLGKAQHLSFARCSVGQSGCQLLANEACDLGEHFDDFVPPPPLPLGQLRTLDVRACTIGDAGLEILARAPTLTELSALDLTQNRLSPAALEHLRSSKVLHALRELSLAGNNDLGPQLGTLAGWPVLTGLERLTLPQTTTAEAFEALFTSPSAKLRELSLNNNKTLGARPELVSASATQLTRLDLGTAKLEDQGAAKLLAAASVASLTSLRLNGCGLSDKSITALTKSPLTRLNRLDLSSNKLTDKGLTALAQWPGLRHVSSLRLGNNRKLTRLGYAALVDSQLFEPAQLLVGKLGDDAHGLLVERYGARVLRE